MVSLHLLEKTMQTKNINLAQSACHTEVQTVAFRSSMVGGSCQDVRNSSSHQDNEGNGHPIPPSVYLPVPPPSTQHSQQFSDLPINGFEPPQHHPSPVGEEGTPSCQGGLPRSSIYQPPPLPPRVGNSAAKMNAMSPAAKEWTKREQMCVAMSVNGALGPYKPVPPPKPFAGSQILAAHLQHQHHQHTEGNDTTHVHQNGQLTYPHILVTEQGQFVTHSTKFPIGDDNEKLVKRFNESNTSSVSQGIDNPALITDSPAGPVLQGQPRDTTPNHYAPMRSYEPSKPPSCLPNGHHPHTTFHRPPFIQSYQHQDIAWQNHLQANSVRFTVPPVGQSPERKTCMNGNLHFNPNQRERSYCIPHQPQHNVVRDSGGYHPDKNSHFQESIMNPNSPNFKHADPSVRIATSQTNGTLPVVSCYSNGVIGNGELPKQCVSNNETSDVSHDVPEAENRKEDKWGSLKRAGKKYSNFKTILSNKFTKTDTKGNSGDTNASSPIIHSKGTNSQDLPKNLEVRTNGEVLNSERLHNGDNHLQENNRNFQRTFTYGSLKAKLDDDPPQQHPYEPHLFISSERPSDRLPMRNPNGSFLSNFPRGGPLMQVGKPNEILAGKRAGSCSHLGAPPPDQMQQPPSWAALHRSDDNLTRPLASDQSYPERNSLKPKDGAHVHFHGPPTAPGGGRVSGGSDSGRGTGGGSATEFKGHDTSLESGSSNNRAPPHGHSSGNESEWVDIPEMEEQHGIYRAVLDSGMKYPDGTKTPPLPPLLPEGSPHLATRMSSKSKKQINSFSSRDKKRPDIVQTTEKNGTKTSENVSKSMNQSSINPSTSKGRWNGFNGHISTSTQAVERDTRISVSQSKSRNTEWRQGDARTYLDDDDLNSTDAALDLNSVLDGGVTEATTDDELGSTRDDENYIIRRQLEGLEGMYSEVLKVLGGRRSVRHPDPRLTRRRAHGSVSSLPSSVMSGRGVRDRKGKVIDDRLRKANKDISKATHKRFQRLESHVVTLARSIAHLSSEMRTQQLMLQEIESIRSDLSALKMNVKPTSVPHARGGTLRGSRLWNDLVSGGPPWNNPGRVKKLTQFFGDEPPLVRIFLKKLGYEKYAPIFEKEKIGMLELPYMTEDRLHKIGIPLGPRLRILEEARGPIKTEGNLSVYVV